MNTNTSTRLIAARPRLFDAGTRVWLSRASRRFGVKLRRYGRASVRTRPQPAWSGRARARSTAGISVPSALRIERPADRFEKSPLRCRFRRRRVREIASLLASRRRVKIVRYAPTRNDPHPTCSPPVPNPPHATARRAPTRASSRVGGLFAECLFFPRGCPLLTPASNARQVTRDAPRSSGFPHRDTYAREDAPRAACEPFAR